MSLLQKDVLLLIFRLLRVSERMRAGQVCRAWCAASRAAQFWNNAEWSFESYIWLPEDESDKSTGFERCRRLVPRFRTTDVPVLPAPNTGEITRTAKKLCCVGGGRSNTLHRFYEPNAPVEEYCARRDFQTCILSGVPLFVDDVLGYHNGAERMRVLHYPHADAVLMFFDNEWSWGCIRAEYIAELKEHASKAVIVLINAGYEVSIEDALTLARDLGARAYARVDWRTGKGVKELFQCVLQLMLMPLPQKGDDDKKKKKDGKKDHQQCSVQ